MSYAKAGRKVLIADPINYDNTSTLDYRTTAYLQPSKLFLEKIGVWAAIQNSAVPLEIMRIMDASGGTHPGEIKTEKDFKSSDISELPFGWNVQNSLMRKSLKDLLVLQNNCKIIKSN